MDARPNPKMGQYGGVVLRAVTTTIDGKLTTLQPGQVLAPDMVLGWPFQNRAALLNTERVKFYEKAVDAERDGLHVTGRKVKPVDGAKPGSKRLAKQSDVNSLI